MRCAKIRLGVRMTGAIAMSVLLVSVWTSTAWAIDGDLKRRWLLGETPYEEQNFARKVGSDLRDGIVGLIDSVGQGR